MQPQKTMCGISLSLAVLLLCQINSLVLSFQSNIILGNKYLRKNERDSVSLFSTNKNVETRSTEGLQDGLHMRYLPGTDLLVSELCLGSMMFGDQLTQEESIKLLDHATKNCNLNFIDTSEIYPAPTAESSFGKSEKIIGKWLKGLKKKSSGLSRDDIVISSSICGYSKEITWGREGGVGTDLSEKQIIEAVDAKLERLGTDYIDLLQFHWPQRYTPLFGAPVYDYELERDENEETSIQVQLETVNRLIKEGKVRHFGLSNETPYGATMFKNMAKQLGLKAPVSVQNAYNLLERNDFETGMLEVCSSRNANLGFLAYSPLAGGALTGKYLDLSAASMESRLKKFVGYMHRYISPPSVDAVNAYMKVAEDFALPLSTVALAFVYSRPFVTSTIIGATSVEQLTENIHALNLAPISKELNAALDKVYRQNLDPTKGTFDIIDTTIDYVDPSKLPWGAKDQDVDPELDILINQRIA